MKRSAARRESAGDADALAGELEHRLAKKATRARAKHDRAYLKSADTLTHLGTTVPRMRGVVAAFVKEHPITSHDELWALVDALWDKPVYERRSAATMLLCRYPKLLASPDLAKVEQLLRESKTWALVDELSAHVVGGMIERDASLAAELDRWATDEDFWIRRSAMLALLKPLRSGGGDWTRFTRYADAMLAETEFFIRKAIGWILREVSKKRPALVIAWVEPRAKKLSGVTWREVVRRLPAKEKAALERRREASA